MNLNRWMYSGRRPNALARGMNRASAAVYGLGVWPSRLAALDVTGRRTARRHALPVVIAEVGDERYLVAMLGERAAWVANVRAAGGRAVLRHGAREDVVLEELPPAERPPVLRRYLEVAPGARAHMPVDHRTASLEDLAAIAPEHPVFRITRAPTPGR